MRAIALARLNAINTAALVEHDARLSASKIQRTSMLTFRTQNPVDVQQHTQARADFWSEATHHRLGGRVLMQAQHVCDLVVGQPRRGLHYAFIKLVATDAARARDGHVADHAQPVHIGAQRTQTIGDGLRQHRNDHVGEIHRVTTTLRFRVQRRSDLHVMAHVRNGDEQSKATTGTAFGIHGIIEIACVFAIDGDERQIAQVNATGKIVRIRLNRHRCGFRKRRCVELTRNPMCAENDFALNACLFGRAQHPHHFAARTLAWLGGMCQTNQHVVAGAGSAHCIPGHDDLFVHQPAFRANEKAIAVIPDDTDHRFAGAFEHRGDVGVGLAVTIQLHANLNVITVNKPANFLRAYRHVCTAVIELENAAAIAPQLHARGSQTAAVQRCVSTLGRQHQLAIPTHRAQTTRQRLGVGRICQLQMCA